MSKQFLALALLLAVPAVKSTVDMNLGKYAPVAALCVGAEVLRSTKSDFTRSGESHKLAHDFATAAAGAATVSFIKDRKIDFKEAAQEGVTSYLALKMSQLDSVKEWLSKVPGIRALFIDTDNDKQMSAQNLSRYAGCYVACKMAIEFTKKTLTGLVNK